MTTGRAVIGLGVGAAASVLLSLADKRPWWVVTLDGTGRLILLVLAAVTVAAGLLAMRALVAVAGLAFLAAAVLQLVQMSWTGANLLGGDGSTLSLLLGFAVGLLALGLTPAPASHGNAPEPR